jgi:hypothetical protein
MHCAHILPAVFILLAFATSVSAQGQLVIVTENTKQYHRPSCPLVRDGKDVIAMTMGQAEARGFKSHTACEATAAANDPAAGNGTSGRRQPAIFVYTAEGDTRYHKESCAKLPKERRKVALEDAGKKLWPCSVCRPPIRKRTPAIPKRYSRD